MGCEKDEKANRIIIATDSDSAGQAMAEEIARRIGKTNAGKLSSQKVVKTPMMFC